MYETLSQSEITQLNDFKQFLKYQKTWDSDRFFESPAKFVALFTGNQRGKCLTYDSLIDTPSGEVSVGELFESGDAFMAYSYENGNKFVSVALPPFKKDKKEPCVKIELSNGKSFEAALGHRVLTNHGYAYIADLLCNLSSPQPSFSLDLPQSNSEPCQLVRASGGLRCSRKGQDCPGDCSKDYHLCDGQPLSGQDSDLSFLPSQGDVQQHNSLLYAMGGLLSKCIYTRRLSSRLLSNLDVACQSVARFSESLSYTFCNALRFASHGYPSFVPQPSGSALSLQLDTADRQYQYASLQAYKSPYVLVNGNRIISYQFIGCKEVYDFTVPHYHNYYAAGEVHHNTAMVAFSYVLRILGFHPVATKNIEYWECESYRKFKDEEISESEHLERHKKLIFGGGKVYEGAWNILTVPQDMKCPFCGSKITQHDRGSRVLRFCSETLPGQSGNVQMDGGSAEVKNTQYPELKKWLPNFLIKKDITFRNPAMIIKNINCKKDIVVEFVSYQQSIQSTAGTQRISVWYDEEPGEDFREEQKPRLLAEDGDEVVSLTPANHISWMYDEVFEKAQVYYRTKAICDFLSTENNHVKRVETTESDKSIAVIQAATDDNPTLKHEAIESLLGTIDDPDILAIRRYGIFKQVSGRIFKDFEYKTHFIDKDKYFEDGLPASWTHARGIDYHPQTPWAFGCMMLSPTNEAFIYSELNPSPEKFTIKEIANQVARTCKDYKYSFDLCDPLIKAQKRGSNADQDSITALDEFNDEFHRLKRESIGTGGYWEAWDTKGEKGRDEIRKRLKNSLRVGKPFNNDAIENGKRVKLPTLWIMNDCKLSAQSMRQWRWEQYTDKKTARAKGEKNTPEQKWSHFNMVWEAIFKDPRFKPKLDHRRTERGISYFQGAR